MLKLQNESPTEIFHSWEESLLQNSWGSTHSIAPGCGQVSSFLGWELGPNLHTGVGTQMSLIPCVPQLLSQGGVELMAALVEAPWISLQWKSCDWLCPNAWSFEQQSVVCMDLSVATEKSYRAESSPIDLFASRCEISFSKKAYREARFLFLWFIPLCAS